MIAYLSGKIQSKDLKSLIINVNGVGYQVHTTPPILVQVKLGEQIELYTYLHVREDALELYGFENTEDLDFFTKLISVSGIGPKSALGVFVIAKVSEIKQAIINQDADILTRVSGIGKKTAERIIVDLRGKIEESGIGAKDRGLQTGDADAVDALVGLGYSHQQAIQALRQAGEGKVEERLKQALKILGQK